MAGVGQTLVMALRPLFAPLHPDLDPFLFAVVGGERNGIPLSTISALTQLDLDPWDEAGRLAGLAKGDAVEQLTGLLLRLPGPSRPLAEEVRQIAVALIDVLPPAVLGYRRVAAVQLPIMMLASIVGVWLFSVQHRRQIEAIAFNPVTSADTGVGFDIGFNIEDDALFFKQAFS